MAETKDFIEAMQEESLLRHGREITPEEAGEAFLHHGLDARIQHLKNLKTDESLSLRAAAKRLVMERALKNAHHSARRSGR